MKVAQCWDDGVSDDIRVIEILRKNQAKASFNLNLALHTRQRTSEWKYKDIKKVWKLAIGELVEVYEGFSIANHTATHPHLTRIPIKDALRDIREGRDALEQHFGRAVTGFAYPFGEYNSAVVEAVRGTGHTYARTIGCSLRVIPPKDPMVFHPSCHFLDPNFWTEFERVKSDDGVFYFWGHSYELITNEDWRDFDAKISRIASDRSVSWVELPDLFDGKLDLS